jgi:Flp pilus assembly protein TadD
LQLIAVLDRARPERQVALGLAQARSGQEELAVLTLGHALDRTPDHPLIYGALGQVWLRQATSRGDAVALGKALEALERAASTDATSTMLEAYGRALLMDNQIEAAERVLLQATRRYPVDPIALTTYAAVAERLNHAAAARTALIDYGALVADEPDFGARAASIARLSLRLNDQGTAAAWIARGLEKDPANAALQALDTRVK